MITVSKVVDFFFRKGQTGWFGLNVVNGATMFNDYSGYKEKLAAVLKNPAAMKVFSLQCDLFSMGKVYVYDGNENELEQDPFLNLIKNPNPFQGQSQFLWDFMFWNMMGTAYCYVDSWLVDRPENRMYFLDPSKIEWPTEFENQKDKLVFSDATVKKLEATVLTYRYDDGTTFEFPLSKLAIMTDLTNGIGNWYKGPSRLDALYKVITNSEEALNSKNINLRYSGKFLVGSNNDVTKMGLSDDEKKDIEQKIDKSDQKVWPVKTMVEIKRFVENIAHLALDASYQADYFTIGSMYGIPRDVLETYLTSSTYENQEKATGRHVAYCFEPKGNAFFDVVQNKFGYTKEGKNILIDWSHLSFMQAFEKERSEIQTVKINNFKALRDMGVSVDEANAFLDLNIQIDEQEEIQQGGNQGQAGGESTQGQGAGNGTQTQV